MATARVRHFRPRLGRPVRWVPYVEALDKQSAPSLLEIPLAPQDYEKARNGLYMAAKLRGIRMHIVRDKGALLLVKLRDEGERPPAEDRVAAAAQLHLDDIAAQIQQLAEKFRYQKRLIGQRPA